MLVDANVTIHGLLHCGGVDVSVNVVTVAVAVDPSEHRSRFQGEPRLHARFA